MPKPSAIFRVNTGINSNGWVKLLGVSLLVILSVSFATLGFFSRKVPSREQTASNRTGWYFSSGQWHADVHTLVAAFEYLLDRGSVAPATTSSSTNQLTSPTLLHVEGNVVPNLDMLLEAPRHYTNAEFWKWKSSGLPNKQEDLTRVQSGLLEP